MLVFAHRGASGEYDENTASAISHAINKGADGIEIDVQSCKDNYVILHDRSLNRTTNGTGNVLTLPLCAIQQYRTPHAEIILSLMQAIALVGSHAWLNLELKHTPCLQAFVQLLEQCAAQNSKLKETLLVSSFNHPQLAWVKQRLPWLKIGALTASIPLNYAQFATELNAYSLHANVEFISQDLITDAHQRGLKVFVYTVDKKEEIERLYHLGVDGIFSNYPAKSKAFIRSLGDKKQP